MLKTLKKTFLFIFLFFYTSLLTYAQWQQSTELTGAFTRNIVKAGSSLFVTTKEGALHRSIDNGVTWSKVENGLPAGHHSYNLHSVNGVLYLQTDVSGTGLYRSADNGVTWVATNINIIQGTIYDITSNNSTLYAASNNGIYISTDNGINWIYKPVDVVGHAAYSILYFEGKLLLGTDYILVSEDQGDTWTEIDFPGRGPNGIRHMMVHNNQLYIANNAKLWTLNADLETFNGPIYYNYGSIINLKSYNNELYVTGYGSYAFSADDGMNWTFVDEPNDQTVYDLIINEGKVLITGDQGLHSSENNGVSWTSSNTGLNAVVANELNTAGTTITTFVQFTGLLKTSDAGNSWENINGNLPTSVITGNTQDIFNIGNKIVAVTNRDIYRSTDNGLTYEITYVSDGLEQTGEAVYKDGVLVVITKKNQLIISTDDGATWSTRNLGDLEINNALSQIAIEGQNIAIASKSHKVLFTDDLGETWVERPEIFSSHINDIDIHKGKVYVLSGNRISESSDNGATWSYKFSFLGARKYRMFFINDLMYAIGNSIGFADIGGSQFYDITKNLEGIFIRDILNVENEIYVSTNGHGIWKSTITDIPADMDNDGVADVDDECPDTEEGQSVNDKGCSSYQLDDDNDGVFNPYDYCDDTAAGEPVNGLGCAAYQLDSDNDGVSDDIDQCNFVNEAGVEVNDFGCVPIAQNSVKVLTKSPTCPNETNGVIEISTTLNNVAMNKVTLTNENNQVSYYTLGNADQPLFITDLASGSYTLNIEIYGSTFNYTYIVAVNALENLSSGKRTVNKTDKTVSYALSGSKTYTVNLNDITRTFYFDNVDTNTITLSVTDMENKVLILGESDCQGIIEDQFILTGQNHFYPSLTQDIIDFDSILIGSKITLFNLSGTKVFETELDNTPKISIGHLETGAYILHINVNGITTTHKIIKQ
ncbi:T9SS type A sorting domain-containing protein [Maribacter sp. LLG6340-A2]|uniref:T9SS type A sorting domain-containing protein n=1 Tax=Maribacter sp. LLG6340-A2 TaxID=3160834 RepID=UPI00386E64F1